MSIWVKCMYVYGVLMYVREFWSFHALYGAANALYWKCLKRQNSTYLTLLKHQNTKTSLYKLSKNHWVITLLGSFGSVRRELQSTVSLDHPVEVRNPKNSGPSHAPGPYFEFSGPSFFEAPFIIITVVIDTNSAGNIGS